MPNGFFRHILQVENGKSERHHWILHIRITLCVKFQFNDTLEKDKEDQSKYYFSYPKPPVLDVKWGNRGINLIEWANIPTYSMLDDILTSLKLLELFFDDVLVDMIFGYTKLYSHREKAGISFGITNEKIRFFLSMLVGAISFQTIKCIGRRTLILLWKQGLIQCLVICSCVYLRIFIFMTTNNLINKTNSRSSFPWWENQIGDFESSLPTGRTNPSYDSRLRNSWQ